MGRWFFKQRYEGTRTAYILHSVKLKEWALTGLWWMTAAEEPRLTVCGGSSARASLLCDPVKYFLIITNLVPYAGLGSGEREHYTTVVRPQS